MICKATKLVSLLLLFSEAQADELPHPGSEVMPESQVLRELLAAMESSEVMHDANDPDDRRRITVSPDVVEEDMENRRRADNVAFRAYWDKGSCGPDGDDANWAVCGKQDANCPEVIEGRDECDGFPAHRTLMKGHGKWGKYWHEGKCEMAYYAEYTCGAEKPQEPFTVVFFADLEANYRGHKTQHARRVLEYIRDLKHENFSFSDGTKIDPKLVVHGGDINHDGWNRCHGDWAFFTCRTPDQEFKDIWNVFYDAGIPAISNFGNHDWRDHVTDKEMTPEVLDSTNKKTMEFVRKTFEKSAKVDKDFAFTKFEHGGDIGPDTFKATFRGLQIAMFQQQAFLEHWSDSDKMKLVKSTKNAEELAASLDRDLPTMFVDHFPIAHQRDDERKFLIDTIKEFGKGSAHFAGHVHLASQNTGHYANRRYEHYGFTDYVSSYPYTIHLPSQDIKPGFYAVLVDPVLGIREVKQMAMKAKCWKDGTRCLAGTTCNTECCEYTDNWEHWYSVGMTACGKEPNFNHGSTCGKGTSCHRCPGGNDEVEGPMCWLGICKCK